MRVLFYLYPALLSQGPEFNAGWSLLMARLMRGLVDTGTVRCLMITARRFEPALTDALNGLPVGYVDDLALQREMVASDPLGAVPTEMSRRVRSAQPLQYPNVIRLVEHVQKASDGFVPDVVITFGMQADYVKHIWPDVPVLHAEATAFSRNPYPFSIFFDHLGMYRNSAPAVMSESHLPSQSPASYDMLDEVRNQTANALATHDPFKSFDFRHRFKRVVLMPLQVSNYYSFDEQASFRTQFELLVQMLSAAPPDVGVIVTEYIQWGEVLNDDGGAANLSWLKRSFPNLIFHEEFRSYDSASQYILPHVDGLFTISSNLGYQALLHRKRLVCSARSHLRSMSHDTNLTAFFAKIVGRKAAEPRDEFLAWYLSHYAVPFALACDGNWLRDYLNRRLTAIKRASRAVDGFVPVAADPILRTHWLNPAGSQAPGRFETPKAALRRARATLSVKLASTIAVASASGHIVDFNGEPGAESGNGYLLLNDMRSVDGASHWGYNTFTALVDKQMRRMGLSCAGRLNCKNECTELLVSGGLDRVRLALFNGEGFQYQDQERARDLMSFCRVLKQRGIRCVLINAGGHENTRATGELLDAFDIVTVRESISLAAIKCWRPDTRLVPDLTLSAGYKWPTSDDDMKAVEQPFITVLDHVEANCALKLAGFARFHSFPFYLMGQSHVGPLVECKGSVHESDGAVFPQIMLKPTNLDASLGCLTGRYHGFVAALLTGSPVLALALDTPVIEGVLADIGLGRTPLLGARWLNQGHHHQRAVVEQRLGSWTATMTHSTEQYVCEAAHTIEALWQDIAGLLKFECVTHLAPRKLSPLSQFLSLTDPAITIGQHRDIALSVPGAFVADGFHQHAEWGLWSSKLSSQLTFNVDPSAIAKNAVLTVRMDLHVFEGLLSKDPALRISNEGQLIGYVFFRSRGTAQQSVEFSLVATKPLVRLDMQMTDMISPSEAGFSVDGRQLGFALRRLSLSCETFDSNGSNGGINLPQPKVLLWGIDSDPIPADFDVRHP